MSKRVPSAILILVACAASRRPLPRKSSCTRSQATIPAASWAQGLSGVGDVDLDGFADFVVGEPFAPSGGVESGRAQLFSGASGAILFEVSGQAGDWLGYAVAGVGDLDGDGIPTS
jgi:hypothetical protein